MQRLQGNAAGIGIPQYRDVQCDAKFSMRCDDGGCWDKADQG